MVDTAFQLETEPILVKPTSTVLDPPALKECIQPLENRQMNETLHQKPPTQTANTIVPHELEEPDDTFSRDLKKSFRNAKQMIDDESNNPDNAEGHIPIGKSHFQATTTAAKPVDTQTIFASEIEDKLFHLLTNNIIRGQRR